MHHTRVRIATELGDMEFILYPEKAPLTVKNFLRYLDDDRYQNCNFFRIVTLSHEQIDDPVKIETIQGGLNIDSDRLLENIPHEATQDTGLQHKRGSLSLARYEVGSGNGSFFVCFRDEPALDHGGARQADGQGFAVFGDLIKGDDVLDRLYQRAEEDEYLQHVVMIENVYRL